MVAVSVFGVGGAGTGKGLLAYCRVFFHSFSRLSIGKTEPRGGNEK